MVGTGVVQTDYQRDVTLKTARNPNCWRRQAHLDGHNTSMWRMINRLALFKSGAASPDLNSNGRIANDLKAPVQNRGSIGSNHANSGRANADSPGRTQRYGRICYRQSRNVNTFGYGYIRSLIKCPVRPTWFMIQIRGRAQV
jgi:hypothetical protein